MTLLKTGLLNGLAVVIKMLTLLGINKVLAVYIGPSGYAAIGQFQNAIQIISIIASGSVSNGVTKYTAEYHDDINKQVALWKTAVAISVTAALISSVLIVYNSSNLSKLFFDNHLYRNIFTCFGICIVFIVLNSIILSILNGKKELNKFVLANILGSVLAFVITVFFSIAWGIQGALIALVVYQALSFFTTIVIVFRLPWFKLKNFIGKYDHEIAKNLLKYTLMALVTAITVPVSQIIVRTMLSDNFGADKAGFVEAMWRLSSTYLLLITTTLSVYFLPKFSELKRTSDIRKEVYNGLISILPICALFFVLIYLFRSFAVKFLFSEGFSEMQILFPFQLLGDFFKVASWLIGFVFISKAMYKVFIFIEVFFSFLFVVLAYFMLKIFDYQVITVVHTINYFLCLIFVILYFYKKDFDERSN
jgi:PST family polysaccharide transporter